jgi:alpha-N-acetylglucosamine transferase
MYVDKNIDELFDLPNMSATIAGKHYYPDWTNLNSGLMVITPKEGVLEGLKEILFSKKFESHVGDQDIIGNYFDWKNQKWQIMIKQFSNPRTIEWSDIRRVSYTMTLQCVINRIG